MKVKRKIIEIDEDRCNGCGQCVIACAEGAIQIIDGKAKVVSDNLCDGLGACIGECPEDALHIIQREAEEFDEEAVEKHLETLDDHVDDYGQPATLACGCPSTQVQTLAVETPCQAANRPVTNTSASSTLSNWPVQIHLVPPTAPFLKGAHLLVAADCVPVAFPRFQGELLPGKTVMIGCPKFDNKDSYVEKFSQIFKTAGIKRITCVRMEVPCCSGLPMILKEAMQAAGVNIPMEVMVVSSRGDIVETSGI